MAERYRVISTHAEDIASGAMFEPGEWAIGVDPDRPFDRAKIEAGKLLPESGMTIPQTTPAAEARAVELGIDLSTVIGNGADGRITVGDVESAADTTHQEEESK